MGISLALPGVPIKSELNAKKLRGVGRVSGSGNIPPIKSELNANKLRGSLGLVEIDQKRKPHRFQQGLREHRRSSQHGG